MNNELIKKGDISFWNKIKIFLKSIFKNTKEKSETNTDAINNIKKSNSFNEEIKVNGEDSYLKEYKLKEFTKEIEKNPDLINKLSNDRLDKIISYYENITAIKRDKIQKLKKDLN